MILDELEWCFTEDQVFIDDVFWPSLISPKDARMVI